MKRHYFVGQDIADLQPEKAALMAGGIPELQLHVLSQHEADLEIHQLRPVADFMKTDVIHRGLQGLVIGLVSGAAILALTSTMGWQQQAGWVPFVFLAIVAVGFCTWEGGFLGFQQQNPKFSRFQPDLLRNRYILFVDIMPDQEFLLRDVLDNFAGLKPAGSGEAMPGWVVRGQQQIKSFVHWAP